MRKSTVFLLTLSIAAAVSGALLVSKMIEYERNNEVNISTIEVVDRYRDVSRATVEHSEDIPEKEEWERPFFSPEIAELKKENPDTVGHLYISDAIDLPVLASRGGRYLSTDYFGNRSSYGCIFTENESEDKAAVLQGHNMKNGAMFGFLERYKDEEYWKMHRTVCYTTEASYREYEVCGYLTMPAEDPIRKRLSMKSREDASAILARMKKSGKVYEQFDESDNLLILATCEYTNTNGRLLVICRQRVNQSVR